MLFKTFISVKFPQQLKMFPLSRVKIMYWWFTCEPNNIIDYFMKNEAVDNDKLTGTVVSFL